MAIHGGARGGLDGIDVWGSNICKSNLPVMMRTTNNL